MHYEFPIIRTIDDVLPHIEGREEFIVAERDFGTVINYVVAMADTFEMIGIEDLTGAIRRECRGLIFDTKGKLISRPFHKFFNIGEKQETQVNKIDMSRPHVIMEKMDGSMIRPIVVDGQLRLATKMGITDVSEQAEAWLASHSHTEHLKQWMRWCYDLEVTPLFEWVSKDNRIVLEYDKEDLVLLAMRCNETGEYSMPDACPFTVVPQYGSLEGNLQNYVERQHEVEGREGDIIRFIDGHMLKVKNSWYVRIHKVLDRIRFDRNIVDLIINEQVDDIIPVLPQDQADRVRDFEQRFWDAFNSTEDALMMLYLEAKNDYDGDRKRIALELVPTLTCKQDAQFIFRMLDGQDLRELMLAYIKKNISTNVKWDACAEWIGV